MTHSQRLWLLLSVVLALCFLRGDGAAQLAGPIDLFQFPELTDSKPFQRWWWAFQQRAYPLGEVPVNAQLHALQQVEQSKAVLPPAAQPVSGSTWINVGPAPILGGQIGFRGNARPMSGRVADVVVDPNNASRWLIGAAQGGVWETRDAGAIWTPKTDDQASLSMGAIAFAPSNPNIVYAGTGEAVFSGDAYAGAGLLKSTDGGDSWQLLAVSTFAKTAFSDISVHPTNPDTVLAATTHGFAGRGVSAPFPPPPTGIFKSTNGGVTWSQQLDGEATDLEVDPGNFNKQYAAIGNIFDSSANGVYRSTDAGETWTLINGPWSTLTAGVGRIELAIAPSNPNTLYVSIQDAFNGTFSDGRLLGLWRTDNAFAATPTWTQVPTVSHDYCGTNVAFPSAGGQCWYDHEISVDPTIANTLYAGGIDLWKCTNCGTSPTWAEVGTKVSKLPGQSIHQDQHAMAWVGNRLIVGNDGGVWSTTDGGNTWANHNTNLAITQFYDGSIHPTNPNFALGGSQDNGTEKWTGTDAWQWIFSGDGADNAISSSDPNNDWALSLQNLNIFRTTNGDSFSAADSGIDKSGAPFIARFEKCPANDNVFIAGTDNVWRSNNFFGAGSPTWSANSPDTGAISALAFAPSDT
ncbi:MAG: WD40/YVTN/BNR-like repeat-containing protein, partial [Candidatus Binatia bacterium]